MSPGFPSACRSKGFSQRGPGLGTLSVHVTAGLAVHLLFLLPSPLSGFFLLSGFPQPSIASLLPCPSLLFPLLLSHLPWLSFSRLLLTLGSHPQGPFSSALRHLERAESGNTEQAAVLLRGILESGFVGRNSEGSLPLLLHVYWAETYLGR